MNKWVKLAIPFVLSMMPIGELRSAIPTAIALGITPWSALIISIIGNIIPVPFVIIFVRYVLAWMSKRKGCLAQLSQKIENTAHEKSKVIRKYGPIGLLLLVAIPVPGTGAWTGALVAALLDIRLKNAFSIISLGVVIAGLIMLVLSLGVKGLF